MLEGDIRPVAKETIVTLLCVTLVASLKSVLWDNSYAMLRCLPWTGGDRLLCAIACPDNLCLQAPLPPRLPGVEVVDDEPLQVIFEEEVPESPRETNQTNKELGKPELAPDQNPMEVQ